MKKQEGKKKKGVEGAERGNRGRVLEHWGAGVECWSCWPSAVEEVLKFRLFFCNKKIKKNERRGVQVGPSWPAVGSAPGRKWTRAWPLA